MAYRERFSGKNAELAGCPALRVFFFAYLYLVRRFL